jgi:hypothetical protein
MEILNMPHALDSGSKFMLLRVSLSRIGDKLSSITANFS